MGKDKSVSKVDKAAAKVAKKAEKTAKKAEKTAKKAAASPAKAVASTEVLTKAVCYIFPSLLSVIHRSTEETGCSGSSCVKTCAQEGQSFFSFSLFGICIV